MKGVKKIKTLKEGIEPSVESDKYMVYPEDITPVTLHYKISLNAVRQRPHYPIIFAPSFP